MKLEKARKVLGFADIGAEEVALGAASIGEGGEPHILGFACVKSQGFSAERVPSGRELGVLLNLSAAKLEKDINARIEDVVFVVPSGAVSSHFSSAAVKLNPREEVSARELARVWKRAAARVSGGGRALHAVALGYTLDGEAAANPLGARGRKLGAMCHLARVSEEAHERIFVAAAHANLHPVELVAASYAAGLAALSEREKHEGAAVLDIGRFTTGIGIFYRGEFAASAYLPMGGEHITDILARKIRSSRAEAERLKILYGAAAPEGIDFAEQIDILTLDADGEEFQRTILKSDILGAIRPVASLFFEAAREQIARADMLRFANSIVLCGGGAALKGAAELASSVFDVGARIGVPRGVEGVPAAFSSARYAALLGSIIYHHRKSPAGASVPTGRGILGAIRKLWS
ncbi:MAG: cell division protein FtsA [Rickettsiales bacterium]|nr:cell division protein FtsA [Rickettsiales bacterium]